MRTSPLDPVLNRQTVYAEELAARTGHARFSGQLVDGGKHVIPIQLHIGRDMQPVVLSDENTGTIGGNGFCLAAWKADVGLHLLPVTAGVGTHKDGDCGRSEIR
jgi:hypothetical protein